MEYRYSNEIDPKVYESHGLSYDLPLRMHKEPARESKGALRAQRDWSKHVHPVNDYKGGLGDRYNFMSVTVPECLPERLEVISYANEYAFLYDGLYFPRTSDYTFTLWLTLQQTKWKRLTSKAT